MKENFLERKRDRGKTYEQPNKEKEKKLTLEESLVYQDYASKKEGVSFSEKASGESYREAQIFLDIIRRSKVDLAGVDLPKIDFGNIEQIREVEKRLDSAVREIYQAKKENEDSKIQQFLEKTKGIILPLVFSSFILSSGMVKESQASSFNSEAVSAEKKVSQKEMSEQRVIFNRDKTEPQFKGEYINEWVAKQEKSGIQIDKVIISKTWAHRIKAGEVRPFYSVAGYAEIAVVLKDGTVVKLEGEKSLAGEHQGTGDIFRWISDKMEDAIKKTTGKEVILTDYATWGNELRAQNLAIIDALGQFEQKYKKKKSSYQQFSKPSQHRDGDRQK